MYSLLICVPGKVYGIVRLGKGTSGSYTVSHPPSPSPLQSTGAGGFVSAGNGGIGGGGGGAYPTGPAPSSSTSTTSASSTSSASAAAAAAAAASKGHHMDGTVVTPCRRVELIKPPAPIARCPRTSTPFTIPLID